CREGRGTQGVLQADPSRRARMEESGPGGRGRWRRYRDRGQVGGSQWYHGHANGLRAHLQPALRHRLLDLREMALGFGAHGCRPVVRPDPDPDVEPYKSIPNLINP